MFGMVGTPKLSNLIVVTARAEISPTKTGQIMNSDLDAASNGVVVSEALLLCRHVGLMRFLNILA